MTATTVTVIVTISGDILEGQYHILYKVITLIYITHNILDRLDIKCILL